MHATSCHTFIVLCLLLFSFGTVLCFRHILPHISSSQDCIVVLLPNVRQTFLPSCNFCVKGWLLTFWARRLARPAAMGAQSLREKKHKWQKKIQEIQEWQKGQEGQDFQIDSNPSSSFFKLSRTEDRDRRKNATKQIKEKDIKRQLEKECCKLKKFKWTACWLIRMIRTNLRRGDESQPLAGFFGFCKEMSR